MFYKKWMFLINLIFLGTWNGDAWEKETLHDAVIRGTATYPDLVANFILRTPVNINTIQQRFK